MATDDSWRTQSFRQSVVSKIEEAIQISGMPASKNSIEMENHVFQKAKTREEYLGFVARLILHVREMSRFFFKDYSILFLFIYIILTPIHYVIDSKKGANNATSGSAGTGNQGMPDPIGALQTLARQGTGNSQMIGMGGQGPNTQTIIQQPNAPTATNLLQSLNQRPTQPMNIGLQNKMPGMGILPGQNTGQMGHMGAMQSMQNGQMLTQMNQMVQGNVQQMNQMNQIPGQINQMNTGQMQQNMSAQMQSQIPTQMTNQIGGPLGNNTMQGGLQQQINQLNSTQIGNTNQLQQQMNHIQRKPGEMINAGFPGPRNVAPNQFLRQSPSPSAPSPAGLGAPANNQMVASPALVPSPSPQHAIMTGQQRSVGMAPSPSSSLNTPGGVGATPSPQQEDQAYRDKVRQLSKYIEPLRRMIAKTSSEGNVDKLSKMKKLLEILSNPSKRMPLDTLLKCEIVLEKLDFKRGDGSVGPTITTLKEHHFFSPLLEAVKAHLQTPVANHTLQRTFGPCLEALFGPEIKNLPPPLKKQKIDETINDIPDVLQGEIARLDQRFKVSLDPAQQNGSKCIQLICWLDDRHLPCVPPVSVTVPADYPLTPPRCVMAPHEYATSFLSAVQKALNARMTKLPRRYSVSQLLDTWEMSVRQASALTQTAPVTSTTVLMGL
ncbi:mediator of RNA polymerase II transcription subunit 15-like isoform X2 [Prorops nasuta]|uniref:mediator of RNA polymerase II transcription subunit 15-like isoform X2 n=1 Tax=Prorops nasuta TaxID=863751 RepID=UPI0034CFADDD